MKNNFTKETYQLFEDKHECWYCGMNTIDCLHHIIGRSSNSPYNAAPMCNHKCHLPNHGRIRKDFKVMEYLVKTKKYLESIGYKPTNSDYVFLEKYTKFYH